MNLTQAFWIVIRYSSIVLKLFNSLICNSSFRIYKFLIRFLKIHNLSYKYVPLIFVKMSLGGVSTRGISSFLTINSEIFKACKLNGIKTNYLKLYSKYFIKIFEYFKFWN